MTISATPVSAGTTATVPVTGRVRPTGATPRLCVSVALCPETALLACPEIAVPTCTVGCAPVVVVDDTVIVVGLEVDVVTTLVVLVVGAPTGVDVVVGGWVVLGPGSAVVTISLRRAGAGLEVYRAPWPSGR